MTRSSKRADEALFDAYVRLYPEEVTRLLELMPVEDAVQIVLKMQVAQVLVILQTMIPDVAAQVLAGMGETASIPILSGLEPVRAAVLLGRFDLEEQGKRLALLPPGAAEELKTLMSYPPDTAGGLMDPDVMTFRPDTTAREALSRVRGQAHRRILDLFLVDAEGSLLASVPLQQVAVAEPNQQLEHIPHGAPVSVQAMTAREEVIEGLEQLRVMTLPVVDLDGRLLGAIRYDALVAAAQEEASADIQTMVGASKEERALSPTLFAVKKRLPWLEINLGTAFLAAAVVGLFEGIIAQFTALAVLLPVVAGQSGNTGAQALAVTMRGLALREIRVRHWLRVSLKETTVGLVNGVAVAITTAAAVYVWSGSAGLASIIGTSMVVSMVIAGLSGAAVPLVLTAVGQDPAQSSSIILTTVTDVVGFFSFLGIATLLIGML